MGTYGLRVPASRVGYVPEAQGGLPPGPRVLYVRGTRTSLGRTVRAAYRGTPGLDRLLILVLPEGRWWVPTLCWTLSYALSITFRFVSHAALVFGPHRDPPLLALGKTYLTYALTRTLRRQPYPPRRTRARTE